MIHVIGTRDKKDAPKGSTVINTTSTSDTWSQRLSPFLLGPVQLYGGHIARNVENAWQYSKVYPCYVDKDGNPTSAYFDWAQNGWNDPKAHRYPMGKDVKPLYSYWDGEHLDYVQARRRIYIPVYANAVKDTEAFHQLKNIAVMFDDLYLWCFDGYNHKKLSLTYDQVIDDPNRKMGHSFVLAMLLDGFLK